MRKIILLYLLFTNTLAYSQQDVLIIYRSSWGLEGTFPCIQDYAGTNGNFTLCPMPTGSNIAPPVCMVALNTYDIVMVQATYSDVDAAFITQLITYMQGGGSVYFQNDCGGGAPTAAQQNFVDLLAGIGQPGLTVSCNSINFNEVPTLSGPGAANYNCPLSNIAYLSGGFFSGPALANASVVGSLSAGSPFAFWSTGFGGILGFGTEFYSSGNWNTVCLPGSGSLIWNMMAGTSCNLIANFSLLSNICVADCIDITDLSTPPTGANIVNWDYQITSGAPASSTVQDPTNICFNTPGIFDITLTVQDDAGNIDDTTMQISVSSCAVIDVDPVNDTICVGETATVDAVITGINPPYTYTWSGGLIGAGPHQVSPVVTTSYTISVEDAFGNTADSTVWVIVHNLPQLNISGTDETCAGACNGSADLTTIGNAPYDYIWNDFLNSTTEDISGLCTGNYSVIVTDINGCSDSLSMVIGGPPLLIITGTVQDNTCGLTDGAINLTATGGTGTLTYSIDGGVSFQASGNYNGLGANSYTCIVQDMNGCGDTIPLTINSIGGPIINLITSIDASCNGFCDGQFIINAIGGVQFSIDGGTTYQSSNAFTGICAGNYAISVLDVNGCETLGGASIGNPAPVLAVASGDTTICIGGTAVLTGQGSNGTGAYAYSWDNGDVTQVISVSPTTPLQYCVTVEDANGCLSAPVCLNVQINPPLDVFALSDTTICEGDIEQISSSASGGNGGPYTYTWDQGLGSGAWQTVSPITNTTYAVTVSDGCETPDATASATITVIPVPVISFEGDNLSGCLPLDVNFTSLDVPAGSQCIWDFGDGGSTNDCNLTSNTFNQAGCWDVTLSIITPVGCQSTLTLVDYVCVNDYPVAAFIASPMTISDLDQSVDFINNSSDANFTSGPNSYQWITDNGYTSTSYDFNYALNYEFMNDQLEGFQVCLIATSPEECRDTTCQEIMIQENAIYYVPNTFTPGGDEHNNTFFPVFTSGFDVSDYHLMIFNRWGEVVFESYDLTVGWDGTYKGKLSADNTFTWVIHFGDINNDARHRINGHVTVIR